MKKKPNAAGALTEPVLKRIATDFKVLAEPMRLRLLKELLAGEKHVTHLMEEIGASQANTSKHLAVLTKAGMVASRREGLRIFYRIQDPRIGALCKLMCDATD